MAGGRGLRRVRDAARERRVAAAGAHGEDGRGPARARGHAPGARLGPAGPPVRAHARVEGARVRRGRVAPIYERSGALGPPARATSTARVRRGRAVAQGGRRDARRLTVLGRLGDADDPAERRRLFWPSSPCGAPAATATMAPRSPCTPAHAPAGRASGEGHSTVAAELERWEFRRDRSRPAGWSRCSRPGAPRSRARSSPGLLVRRARPVKALDARVPRDRMEAINAAFYRSLGAGSRAARRPLRPPPAAGQDAGRVRYVTFGSREPDRQGVWRANAVWAFATYREGGLGNLVELLHGPGTESTSRPSGRARLCRLAPAQHVHGKLWPADVPALEAHDPGGSACTSARKPRRTSLRAKYAPVMLDVCVGPVRDADGAGAGRGRTRSGPSSRIATSDPPAPRVVLVGRARAARGLAGLHGPLRDRRGGWRRIVRARCRMMRGPFSRPDPGYYSGSRRGSTASGSSGRRARCCPTSWAGRSPRSRAVGPGPAARAGAPARTSSDRPDRGLRGPARSVRLQPRDLPALAAIERAALRAVRERRHAWELTDAPVLERHEVERYRRGIRRGRVPSGGRHRGLRGGPAAGRLRARAGDGRPPDHGRQGLGRRLLEAALDFGRGAPVTPPSRSRPSATSPERAPFRHAAGFRRAALEEASPELLELRRLEGTYGLPNDRRILMKRAL